MTVAAEITPGHVAFADGLFDSRNRYIRKVFAGEVMSMATGPTMAANFGGIAGYPAVAWRWRVGAATFQGVVTDPGVVLNSPDGFNTALKIAL